jgi:hypothetical protein
MAVGDPSAVSVTTKYKNRVEVSQHPWDHLEELLRPARGMVVDHVFPADGVRLQIETALGAATQTRWRTWWSRSTASRSRS